MTNLGKFLSSRCYLDLRMAQTDMIVGSIL